MTEVEAITRELLSDLLGETLESKFAELSQNCPHRIVDDRGEAVCIYHKSAPGDCRLELCPKIKPRGRGTPTAKLQEGEAVEKAASVVKPRGRRP